MSNSSKRYASDMVDPLESESRSEVVGRKRQRLHTLSEVYTNESERRDSTSSRESGEISSVSSSDVSSASDDSHESNEVSSQNGVYHDRRDDERVQGVAPDTDNIKALRNAHECRMKDITEEEQKNQFRYYGLTSPDDLVHCRCCSEIGHMASACPDRHCDHCGGLHFSNHCPTHRKCPRCRRRGHKEKDCHNRVVQGGGVGDPCDICNQLGHIERECTKLWSTVKDNKPVTRKISADQMIAACYNCGKTTTVAAGGHFGDDCPHLPPYVKRDLNNISIWSAKDVRKYIQEDTYRAGSDGGRESVGRDLGVNAYQLSAFDDMRD